ncbi:PEP-CTERM sorting domain-containing protein [Altericroceibacterium endophyticum]|uniref:PEP-CTERM sorting domain-containing protein n=1 Tax=Altericroceibacterium endophyticum TaxID=1808508 RepID=A0A6I4T0F2_9SPHN|nr:PEP-CTERM sorting domain-containing protein [Altericroceibacterium endophyticum]MXO64427.1 PEP-CTERM sorting domain-containing protein [Altericroceibacterium endophyticum]
MIKKTLLLSGTLGALMIATPAMATYHHHHPGCGHGNSSGGTPVPEPGMLGIAGLGLLGLGLVRARRSSRKS